MAFDVIVIGGSAAGLTAALYTSRQGLKTLLITKDIGGQMLLTNDIENYPGFETIGGFELATKFKGQAEMYGTEFVYEEAAGISEEGEGADKRFKVKTAQSVFEATAVILAFGKTPRDLGVLGEEKLKGRGVSYCAVCDGPLFKGKVVSVVGSGDQALDAANYLANVASKIYFIHSQEKPIGSEELVQQVLGLTNLTDVKNSKVAELKGATKLEQIVVTDLLTKTNNSLDSNALFIEVGYIAKTDFLKGFVKLNSKGEVEVDKFGNTSHEGIFAAGDVTDTPYKQAVISAGQGSSAALGAYNYIQRLRGKTAARTDWRSLKPQAKATA